MLKRNFLCRVASILLFLALLLALPSCNTADKGEGDGKIKIVCSIFAQYDWLRNIIGDSENIELSLLIDNGTDLHSYEPTAADIAKISESDMIVYLGDEIETWIGKALDMANNTDIMRVELTEVDGVLLHNVSAESYGHDHGEHGEHDDHEGHDHGALDEHIWLSLKNAQTLTRALCEAVCALDGDNAEYYRANTDKYIGELEALDGEFASAVAGVGENERFMLFCDRFPFVYLLSDYGVEYAAAFEGCTTDVDADFATVLRLIKEADEHSLAYALITESSDGALAETVISSSKRGGEVLVMNSMQALGARKIAEGYTYISVMRENLSVLKTALGVD